MRMRAAALFVAVAAVLRGAPPTPTVFVAINSQVGHVENRKLARSTWVSALTSTARAAGFDARVRFVLADSKAAVLGSVPVTGTAQSEDGHDDLIVLGVPEGYKNLSQKTAALLRWFSVSAPEDILIEVDDDVFVHVEPLWEQLRNLNAQKDHALYAGYAQKMPTSQNKNPKSKWFVPEGARKAIPTGRYVTGQFKILSRAAVSAAVTSMSQVKMQPYGVGDPNLGISVEDEYLGVLLAHAGVQPTVLQRAVAPQCCKHDDLFMVLDGDTYFVKTQNGKRSWDDKLGTADSLCRYRAAAARFAAAPGRSFCLSPEELSLAHCPPTTPHEDTKATDIMLRSLC